jgi:hypothetical protein
MSVQYLYVKKFPVYSAIAGFLIFAVCTVSIPRFALAEEAVLPDESVLPVEEVVIPVHSENLFTPSTEEVEGNEDDPLEEITGGLSTTSNTDIYIETGEALAGAVLDTDVNTNQIQSLIGSTTSANDLDIYEVAATGTNESFVENGATTTAVTGDNIAISDSNIGLITGDATAMLNIANVINTTVINSTGFMGLVNQVVDEVTSWNLQDIFFPEDETLPSESGQCNLLSCAAEDVVYNIDTDNTGDIVNNADLVAISGTNLGVGEVVSIDTGDAYGAANIINIANTNIIDSNYRLLTMNGIGTLNGDLVLPTEALFRTFFGQANGMKAAEDAESINIVDENINHAEVDNNLITNAETGANSTATLDPGHISTGIGSADSNVINEVNKNLFGGDSLYLLIRVHGIWNGNVFGLPEGLVWTETDEGIVIYNETAEMVPSEILEYDTDSYSANFSNTNDINIVNNLSIDAITGENDLEGMDGALRTGNAYAGANVLNIANTNVVGRNWILAILNILGDFNGNVSFGRPDLWVGGQVQSDATSVGPNTKLVYIYTITNRGDLKATDVRLSNELQHAHIRYQNDEGQTQQANDRDELIGTILPGETKIVSFDAYVDTTLAVGTSTVSSEAALTLHESDGDKTNNKETLTINAVYALPVLVMPPTGGGNGGSSGGGGGGSNKPNKSSNGKVLGATSEKVKSDINPKSAPKIVLKKTANVKQNKSLQAGQSVLYSVQLTNTGGQAYDAVVFDRLINPIGSVVSEQSWDIGIIGAGEKITFEYSINYASDTPSGIYTNTVHLEAFRNVRGVKKPVIVDDASHALQVAGIDQAYGNVGVTMFVPMGNGESAAILTWETIKPTSGLVMYGITMASSSLFAGNPFGLYPLRSYQLPIPATKHYQAITGLRNGTTYSFILQSTTDGKEFISKEYQFTVPVSDTFTMYYP